METPSLASADWRVAGHDWAVEFLQKGLLHQRVRHAYLFTGTSSVGKSTLAHSFAAALNCTAETPAQRPCWQCRSCRLLLSGNHPDVIYSQTDSSTGALKIEEIRGVSSKLALRPYEARYRVAILHDFDRAAPRAQDALLKTLEEPPPTAVLILLAGSGENVLPTITSRCQTLRLRPVPVAALRALLLARYGADEQQASLLARLSGGRAGWAVLAAQNPDMLSQREHALDLLETLLRQGRAGRFETAAELSKDRLALGALLELWQSYWRDVLLLAARSDVVPCNADRSVSLEQRVYDVSAEAALTALTATQQMLNYLHFGVNVNLRLALEVLFLDYPGIPG